MHCLTEKEKKSQAVVQHIAKTHPIVKEQKIQKLRQVLIDAVMLWADYPLQREFMLFREIRIYKEAMREFDETTNQDSPKCDLC